MLKVGNVLPLYPSAVLGRAGGILQIFPANNTIPQHTLNLNILEVPVTQPQIQ